MIRNYVFALLLAFTAACGGDEKTPPAPVDKPLSQMTPADQQRALSGMNAKTWTLTKVTDLAGNEVLFGVPFTGERRPYTGSVTFRYAPTATGYGTIDLVSTEGYTHRGYVWQQKQGNDSRTCSQGEWASKLLEKGETSLDKTCLTELTSRRAVVNYWDELLLTFEVR